MRKLTGDNNIRIAESTEHRNRDVNLLDVQKYLDGSCRPPTSSTGSSIGKFNESVKPEDFISESIPVDFLGLANPNRTSGLYVFPGMDQWLDEPQRGREKFMVRG